MTAGSVGRPPQLRDFQFWDTIDETPADFNLNAGLFGLTLSAGAWGTATLQKLLPDGETYVPVSVAASADSYTELHLPAGQYQLTLDGVTDLVGEIAKIGAWR